DIHALPAVSARNRNRERHDRDLPGVGHTRGQVRGRAVDPPYGHAGTVADRRDSAAPTTPGSRPRYPDTSRSGPSRTSRHDPASAATAAIAMSAARKITNAYKIPVIMKGKRFLSADHDPQFMVAALGGGH